MRIFTLKTGDTVDLDAIAVVTKPMPSFTIVFAGGAQLEVQADDNDSHRLLVQAWSGSAAPTMFKQTASVVTPIAGPMMTQPIEPIETPPPMPTFPSDDEVQALLRQHQRELQPQQVVSVGQPSQQKSSLNDVNYASPFI